MTVRHHSHSAVQSDATPNSPDWLVSALVEMLEGGRSVKGLKYKRADAKRGRPVAPLGTYPGIAERMLDAEASRVAIEKPLRAMLAHIARRARNSVCPSLRDALTKARKEQAESDVSELNLALSCANPDTSLLAAADKELRESIEADERLAECIEQRLYTEKK